MTPEERDARWLEVCRVVAERIAAATQLRVAEDGRLYSFLEPPESRGWWQ